MRRRRRMQGRLISLSRRRYWPTCPDVSILRRRQNIVIDLKCKAKILAISRQQVQLLGCGPTHETSHANGSAEEFAGFVCMDVLQVIRVDGSTSDSISAA